MINLRNNITLISQWDSEKNTVDPSTIKRQEDQFYWACKVHKSHKWKTSVRQRLMGQGCPYCANKKVCETNSLKASYPNIAQLWHTTKNGNKTSSDFVFGSAYKAWWQCDKKGDHIWQDKIRSLSLDGKSCPGCKQKDLEEYTSLAAVNPEAAKEWHLFKNSPLTPKDIASNSQVKYWWQCSKDKRHEWQATAASRNHIKSGCPCCAGKKLCPGNSFWEVHPGIAEQWHPNKNKNITPMHVLAGTKKKYWWKCNKADDHEWKTSCSERARGQNCPYCAGRRVSKSNSLKAKFPIVAKQWHPTKNGDLTPLDVTHGSKQKVWWQCSLHPEHIWESTVNGRTSQHGRGCPMCTRQTSIPEVRILAELQTLFPETSSREKIQGLEVDIYISSLKIGIEFDGSYFHKGKIERDRNKSLKLAKYGVSLIRVRQEPLKKIFPQDVEVKNKELTKSELNIIIQGISTLTTERGIKHELTAYQELVDFIGDNIFNKYVSYFPNPFPEETLAATHQKISKLWDYEKNYPLTPQNFKAFSQKKVHWKCIKHSDHLWEAKIATTVTHNGGCPFCSFHRVSDLNRLSISYPQIAKQWHQKLNGEKSPDDFGKASREVVWWQCDKDIRHVWDTPIQVRVGQKQGCPFCAGKRVNESNSLAANKPEVAKEWHPSKNNDLTPADVTLQSGKQVWWLCPNRHEQFQPISSRVNRKKGCPYCSGLKNYPEELQ